MSKRLFSIIVPLLLLLSCTAKEKQSSPEQIMPRSEIIKDHSEDRLKNYEILNVTPDQYTYSDNFDEIAAAGYSIKVKYKRTTVDSKSNTSGITSIVYVLSHRDGDIVIGQASENGFVNASGEDLYGDGDLKTGSSFISTRFRGFPLEVLEHPFFLTGLATDIEGNLYETEVLLRLEIDLKNLTLQIHQIQY